MKVETIEDVIAWTRELHARLAQCLAHCASHSEEQHARWLLEYLADHEGKLETLVAGFAERADRKTLSTWVYDYLARRPITAHEVCDAPYAEMSFEEICGAVFALHAEVIDLYRYLSGRADVPATRQLVASLLELEEHEAMRLAQQTNRIGDL